MSDAPDSQATCWTLIQAAAAGEESPRSEFARQYLPLVRRYLAARWRDLFSGEIDDAVQEVFLACLQKEGALSRADRGRAGGFRPFLFGVIRNVARRFEDRRARRRARERPDADLDHVPDREDSLDRLLDREWARCMMAQAAEHHQRTALARGANARQGVELLRMRFFDGLPLRDIATRWKEDPEKVHQLYRTAREQFRNSLRKIVEFHQPGVADLDAECRRLLSLLEE